ncbi:MAG: metal-dependent transcriptional regulator [Candidatus Methanomethylophilaceae archaeon]
MTTGNREDYLINILRLTEGEGVVKTTELSSYMNISPASVSEMLKVLSKEGLVEYEKYKGVSLTENGLRQAKNLRRKHHIVERFLVDVLDMDHNSAHNEACAFEHSMSNDSANKMCRMIGAKVDSDCETCSDPCNGMTDSADSTFTISDMKVGDFGVISHLICEEPDRMRKLISMGFVPGREVTIDSKVSSKGPWIVRIGNSIIALDKGLSSLVFVDVGRK